MATLQDISIGCRLEPWFAEIIRDPLSNGALSIVDGHIEGDWGRRYPVQDGILDLQLYGQNLGHSLAEWREGQDAYEAFADNCGRS
jgi:hypothetical protein